MTAHTVTFGDWSPVVAAAHDLVERGWPVLPVVGKAPLVRWKGTGGTRDHSQLAQWAAEFRAKCDGWAISTGAGVVVLDVDPQNGGDETTLPGALPETLTATTPKGGRHYYFRDEHQLPTRAGVWPGIDVRGEGGIVVAPTGGSDRSWRHEDAPLARAPRWLVAALTADASAPSGPTTDRRVGKPPRDYALAALQAACQEVRGAPNGDGNNTLNRQAFSLGVYLPNGYLTREQVTAALLDAALAIRMDRRKSLNTINSGISSSLKDPSRTVTLHYTEAMPSGLGSWAAVDLAAVLAGDYQPLQPSVCRVSNITDGLALFYAGLKHIIVAESEAGKTWLTLHAAHQEVAAGRHVIFYDFEDGVEGVVGRLRMLGCPVAAIGEFFHYVCPDESLAPETTEALVAEHAALKPTLVIVDGVTEAMTMHGWEINSNKDVASFYRAVLNPLAVCGAAVVALDHLPKADEKKRGSIGGVHKLNGIDGAVYRLENVKQIIPGRDGYSRITIDKDRPGQVKKHQDSRRRIADLLVLSDSGDDSVTVSLEAPGALDRPDSDECAAPVKSGNEALVCSVLQVDVQMPTGDVHRACEKACQGGVKPPSRNTVLKILKLLVQTGDAETKRTQDDKNRPVDLWWRR